MPDFKKMKKIFWKSAAICAAGLAAPCLLAGAVGGLLAAQGILFAMPLAVAAATGAALLGIAGFSAWKGRGPLEPPRPRAVPLPLPVQDAAPPRLAPDMHALLAFEKARAAAKPASASAAALPLLFLPPAP